MPVSLFSIANLIGGVALGAYDNGQLVGFILSLPAVWEGEMSQWSCRLAVANKVQNQGIGSALKAAQKEALISMGIDSLLWSYNPHDAKNAHLNLNKLGATIVGFKEGMYPVEPGERAIVKWELNHPKPRIISDVVRLPVQQNDSKKLSEKITALLANGYVGVAIEMDGNDAYYQFEKHD